MRVRTKQGVLLCVAALGWAVVVGAQTQRRAPQTDAKPANTWMKTPMDPVSPDDVIPYIRHLRDEYWDSQIGQFGTLTPKTAVHTSTGDYVAPVHDDPEIRDLRAEDAAVVGTFSRYRTALSSSGRAIYTDVIFSVGHVFKDAERGRALAGLEITVSVPGGTTQSAAGTISYMTDPQAYFMQPGRTYLLVLYYVADGDFYVGTPSWELSGGVVKANSYRSQAMGSRGVPTIVGLTKDELIRTLDERFSARH